MQKVMKERHGSMIVGTFTWPEQNFYCRGDIKSIEDLKGKKIRVQGTSQADLAKAFGASAVTIAFGEVVPALEKGVVDCGITGTMPGLQGEMARGDEHAVPSAGRLHGRHLGGQHQLWDKLTPDTRAFLEKQLKALEDKSWKAVEAETEDGVRCNDRPAAAPARSGPPGKLKLVLPSEADLKAREKALNESS